MAVILGLIVTLEVMVAGGMIFNIDFHSLCGIYCIHHFTPPSCQTDKNRPFPLIDYARTYFPNIYSLSFDI